MKLWLFLLLLLILLCCPVRLELSLRDGWTAALRLLGLWSIPLYPRPERREKEEKPEKPEKTSRAGKKDKAPKPPEFWMDVAELILELLSELGDTIAFWMRHLTISPCRVELPVSGEDAMETAVRYGRACAAAGALETALTAYRVRIPRPEIRIYPDFWQGKPPELELGLSMAPWAVLAGAVQFLARGGLRAWKNPSVQILLARMNRKKK